MKRINENTIIRQKKDILISQVDDEKLMLSMKNNEYYNLNIIGSAIWDLIESSIKVEELIKLLMESYKVEYKRCKEDTIHFLEEMLQKDIIEIIP